MSFILRWLPSFAPALAPLLNPWVLLAFTLWSVGCFGYGLFTGKDAGKRELAEYIAGQARAAVAIIKKVQTLKETVRVPYLVREEVIRDVHHIIEKEIDHVPSRPDCNVTAGWMRVHNGAASGDRRIEGAVDDPADTGVTEDRALAVITGNYRAFHQVANDLTACRAFVGGLPTATR